MKKKLSLINLNNNEVKKNGMKELLKEELGTMKGGYKCAVHQCVCWCNGPYADDMDNDDNEMKTGQVNFEFC